MSVSQPTSGGKEMAKDPVCGMQVDEKKAAATSVYKGATYYFCAAGCKVAFDKSPEKFIGKGGPHAGH
jgi:YHS domain-containing protein